MAVAQYWSSICKGASGEHQPVLMGSFTLCEKMHVGFSVFRLVLQHLYCLIHMYGVLIHISIAL